MVPSFLGGHTCNDPGTMVQCNHGQTWVAVDIHAAGWCAGFIVPRSIKRPAGKFTDAAKSAVLLDSLQLGCLQKLCVCLRIMLLLDIPFWQGPCHAETYSKRLCIQLLQQLNVSLKQSTVLMTEGPRRLCLDHFNVQQLFFVYSYGLGGRDKLGAAKKCQLIKKLQSLLDGYAERVATCTIHSICFMIVAVLPCIDAD